MKVKICSCCLVWVNFVDRVSSELTDMKWMWNDTENKLQAVTRFLLQAVSKTAEVNSAQTSVMCETSGFTEENVSMLELLEAQTLKLRISYLFATKKNTKRSPFFHTHMNLVFVLCYPFAPSLLATSMWSLRELQWNSIRVEKPLGHRKTGHLEKLTTTSPTCSSCTCRRCSKLCGREQPTKIEPCRQRVFFSWDEGQIEFSAKLGDSTWKGFSWCRGWKSNCHNLLWRYWTWISVRPSLTNTVLREGQFCPVPETSAICNSKEQARTNHKTKNKKVFPWHDELNCDTQVQHYSNFRHARWMLLHGSDCTVLLFGSTCFPCMLVNSGPQDQRCQLALTLKKMRLFMQLLLIPCSIATDSIQPDSRIDSLELLLAIASHSTKKMYGKCAPFRCLHCWTPWRDCPGERQFVRGWCHKGWCQMVLIGHRIICILATVYYIWSRQEAPNDFACSDCLPRKLRRAADIGKTPVKNLTPIQVDVQQESDICWDK